MSGDNKMAVETAKSDGASIRAADVGDGLSAASLHQFREYAAEWKTLASKAENDETRRLCLKMASIWWHAAVQSESDAIPRTESRT
jgi:hypothetical protein